MRSRFKASLFSLLFIPVVCFTQHLDSLQVIFKSNTELSVKNQRIDSFIVKYQKNLSTIQVADCYHEIGKYYFSSWKKRNTYENLNKAIVYTQKALHLKENSKTSSKSIKKTLYNLGFFTSISENPLEAIKYYERIKDFKDNDNKTLSALRSLAKIYSLAGDYHKALTNLDILINLTTKDQSLIKRAIQGYINRAKVYSSMGFTNFSSEIKENTSNADSLLNIYSSSVTPYHYEIYQIEGNRLSENGFHKEAIPYFKKILKGSFFKDSLNLSKIHNSIGSSFLHLQEEDSASFYLNTSLTYTPSFSPAYENMGDLYQNQAKYSESLKYYQKAINLLFIDHTFSIRDTIPTPYLEEAKAKYDLLHHLTQKAKAWVAFYKQEQQKEYLHQALQTFESADQLIDIIRFETTEYKSKLYWRQKGAALYTAAVEVCHLLDRPDKAYYFMEKNKAILLLEDLTQTQAKEIAQLPNHLSRREQSLRQKIYLTENNLNLQQKSSSNDSILAHKQKLYAQKRAYKKFIDSLSNHFPEYAAYKKQLPILDYSAMQSQYTSTDEVVLQYILDKEKGFGLLHTDQESILFEIKNIEDLLKDTQSFNTLITTPFASTSEQKKYRQLAYRIFQNIIPESIFSKLKNKKAKIISDYVLQNLSFDALWTNETNGNYLIIDTEITYAYSMSYLDQNTSIQRDASNYLLGVAPVTFQNKSLSNLHKSKKEIQEIAYITQGDTLTQRNASKTRFLEDMPKYQILHLATHADSGTHFEDPWIAFEDQKMTLQEIYASKNQADLVVLSGCKTSLGKLSKGEGVMSLARGFFYAGANSVISSLWEVNDKANQQLMKDFYTGIEQGLSTSSALRNAKLNYLDTHEGSLQSPMYWGALVLIGNDSYLNGSNRNTLIWLGVLGIICIFLIFLYKLKNKKA